VDRAPYAHPFYQCSAEPIGYPAHTIYNIRIGIVLTPDLVIILPGSVLLSSLCYILFRSSSPLYCYYMSPWIYLYIVHVDYNNNAAAAAPVNVRVASSGAYVHIMLYYTLATRYILYRVIPNS